MKDEALRLVQFYGVSFSDLREEYPGAVGPYESFQRQGIVFPEPRGMIPRFSDSKSPLADNFAGEDLDPETVAAIAAAQEADELEAAAAETPPPPPPYPSHGGAQHAPPASISTLSEKLFDEKLNGLAQEILRLGHDLVVRILLRVFSSVR